MTGEIIVCERCGKKYENKGTLPQMCLSCWDSLYANLDSIAGGVI